MATAMATARAAEYDAITEEATSVTTASESEQRRSLAKLRRTWRDVSRRDYFPPRERDIARAALDALADTATSDLTEADRLLTEMPVAQGIRE